MGGRSVSAQLSARPGPAGPEDQAVPRDTHSTSDRENWPTGPEQVRKLASFQGHSEPPQPRPGGIRVSWAGDWASRTRSAPHGRRAERGAACHVAGTAGRTELGPGDHMPPWPDCLEVAPHRPAGRWVPALGRAGVC